MVAAPAFEQFLGFAPVFDIQLLSQCNYVPKN